MKIRSPIFFLALLVYFASARTMHLSAQQPAEDKKLAEVKKELDELESQIRGDKATGDQKIIKDVIAEMEAEYIENHGQLVELRPKQEDNDQPSEVEPSEVEPSEIEPSGVSSLRKLVRKQKTIAASLVELDYRLSQGVVFDQALQTKLMAIRNKPEIRKQPELQKRAMELLHLMMRNRTSMVQRKSIEEITCALVEGGHLAIPKVMPRHSYPQATSGLLQEHRDQIRKLLKLSWNGRRLQLDRGHWSEPFAGRSQEDVTNEVNSLLKARGFKGPAVQQGNARLMLQRHKMGGNSNLASLFNALNRVKTGRRSSGSRNGQSQMSFRNGSLAAAMMKDANSFRLEISEQDDRAAVLRLRQLADGALELNLISDVMFRLRQEKDGAFSIVEITDEESFRFNAGSFAEFYRENIDYCDQRLIPLLDHLGVTPPLSRLDDVIVRRVVRELGFLRTHDEEESQALIRKLGCESYEKREQAFKALEENIQQYAPGLRRALGTGANAEARLRIASLLESIGSDPALDVISELNLLGDPDYLAFIKSGCNENAQQWIAERIEQLTKD